MSLQRMPIMDRLFIGGSYDVILGNEMETWKVERLDYEHFASCKRVLLSDSERMPSRPTSTWDMRKMFGHLMLPYPKLWIEWNNIRGDDASDVWMAVQCISVDLVNEEAKMPMSETEKFRRHIKSHSWMARPFMLHGGRVVALPMSLRVDLDGDGVLHGVQGSDLGPNAKTDNTSTVVDLLWDALVAVGWMNCRNVRVDHHDRPGNPYASRSKRYRNMVRSLDFHTIHLPNERVESDGGGDSGTKPSQRLHHVRGHFKTFTSDAPLLGQHIGTYWWGWQVRGKKENGVVVSDYKVGAPA